MLSFKAKVRRRGPDLRALLIVAGVALLLILGFPLDHAAGGALRYERAGLAGGEIWRLVSAHFVHLSWSHALMNAVALLLILQIFRGSDLQPREWWITAAASALVIDLGLWLLQPGIAWYAGASGVLHGLFVAGIVGLWHGREQRLAMALAVGLVAKLALEGWLSPTSDMFEGQVVTAAHRYGALGGLIAAFALHRRRPRRARTRVMRGW